MSDTSGPDTADVIAGQHHMALDEYEDIINDNDGLGYGGNDYDADEYMTYLEQCDDYDN